MQYLNIESYLITVPVMYLEASVALIALLFILFAFEIIKLKKRLDVYDTYFKAAGIVITRDDITQMLKTKKAAIAATPKYAPGGTEDYLKRDK